jgi:phage shock protein A
MTQDNINILIETNATLANEIKRFKYENWQLSSSLTSRDKEIGELENEIKQLNKKIEELKENQMLSKDDINEIDDNVDIILESARKISNIIARAI